MFFIIIHFFYGHIRAKARVRKHNFVLLSCTQVFCMSTQVFAASNWCKIKSKKVQHKKTQHQITCNDRKAASIFNAAFLLFWCCTSLQMRNFLWVLILRTINRELVILFQFTEHVHCASLISYTIHSSFYIHLIYKLQIFVNLWQLHFHCLCLRTIFFLWYKWRTCRVQNNKIHWMNNFYSSFNKCGADGSSYLMNYSNLKCEKYLSTFGRYSLFLVHYYLHFYLSISLVITH